MKMPADQIHNLLHLKAYSECGEQTELYWKEIRIRKLK